VNKTDSFLGVIQFRGNQITLKEIMDLEDYRVEYRRMFTELRKRGYTVDCQRDSKYPSNNRYILKSPIVYEANGQGVMI